MKGLPNAEFDNTEIFAKEIDDLWKKLLHACNINRIPMFCCIAMKNNEDGTEFKSMALNPAQFEYSLKDNKFSDFTNIMNGFGTYYKAGGSGNEEAEELLKLMEEAEEKSSKNEGADSDEE